MKKIKAIILFLVLAGFQQAKATIYYVDVNQGSDSNNGLFQILTVPPDGPFAKIGYAISIASPGDTIIVSAGSYFEQITISKPLVIWGAQQGVKATGSSRGVESVIYPEQMDFSTGPGTGNVGVWITASGVQIDGFSFDGDNRILTSGTLLNGTDPDISYGIAVSGLFGDLSILNNVMVNYFESFIYCLSGASASENNLIKDCYLFNCGNEAIHMESNFYTDITDNLIDLSPKGIILNAYDINVSRTYQIKSNWLNCVNRGLVVDLLISSGLWQVSQNQILSDGSDPFFIGVYLQNTSLQGRIAFNNNTITGGLSGYYLENNLKSKISINGDSLLMCTYGIYSDNTLRVPRTDTLDLDNVFIRQNNSAGIFCTSDSVTLILKCKDLRINNSTRGLHVAGKVNWLANNSAFNVILGYYIVIDSTVAGKRAKTDIDATLCTFEGKTGAVMTGTEGINAEDKILHYMDIKGLAFVNFKTNHVFVTHSFGNDNLAAGILKLTDGGNVHINGGTTTEDVVISKNLSFNNYNTVQIGIITMLGTAKRLKLIGNMNLSGGLALSDGYIESTLGNAIHLLASASIKGGSPASFVDGILFRKASGTGNVVLPFTIGKGSDYRPTDMNITFGAPSGVTEFSMEMFNGPAPIFPLPSGVRNISQIRYWRSQVYNVANISDIRYKLSYDIITTNDQVFESSTLRVLRSSGGPYVNLGGSGSAAPVGTINSTTIGSGFGVLALANILGGSNLLGKTGPLSIFAWQRGCQGDSTIFTDMSVDLNNSIVGWQWDFGDLTITTDTSTTSNPFYIYQDTGFFNAQLIVTNVFGQKDTSWQMVRITDNPKPIITFISPCSPNPALFEDSGSVNIGTVTKRLWKIDNQQFFGTTVAYTYPAAGNYPVELVSTSSFGCTDSMKITFDYSNTPNVTIDPSGISHVCIGDSITLSSTNTHQRYEWSSGEITKSITRDQTGAAILTAWSSKNCFASDTAFVQIVLMPIVNAGFDTVIYAGTAAFLHGNVSNSSGIITYLWSPAIDLDDETLQNPVARPKFKTGFNLEVTDQYGCVSNDSVYVTLNEPDFIKIPNMVTPNDDGHNDTWDLSNVPDIENSKVVILDHWGGKILEEENYKHTWNGRFEDKDLPEGTYIYIIKLKTYNTEVKGNLLLMR